MLELITNALRSQSTRLIDDRCGYYRNQQGDWGYYMTLWHAGHYYMVSISHMLEAPTLGQVAGALASSSAELVQSGRYYGRRNSPGWWGTVHSGEHWYMISASDTFPPHQEQRQTDRSAI